MTNHFHLIVRRPKGDLIYGMKWLQFTTKYAEYLQWLSSDQQTQKEMAFEKMCRGWALGTKDFKKVLIEEASKEVDGLKNKAKREKIPRYDAA